MPAAYGPALAARLGAVTSSVMGTLVTAAALAAATAGLASFTLKGETA